MIWWTKSGSIEVVYAVGPSSDLLIIIQAWIASQIHIIDDMYLKIIQM